MGIVECLDQATGKTWVGVYAKGPHMGLVAKDLRDVREQFSAIAEENREISVPLDQIPSLANLPEIDPNDYPLLVAAGVLEGSGGQA